MGALKVLGTSGAEQKKGAVYSVTGNGDRVHCPFFYSNFPRLARILTPHRSEAVEMAVDTRRARGTRLCGSTPANVLSEYVEEADRAATQ